MVKRDYEKIADIIKESGQRVDFLYIANAEKLMRNLCKYFKKENNLFNHKKFRDRAKPGLSIHTIESIIDGLTKEEKK
tara:strand:+ start:1187 stop:1420 length:234 start_codon:yes stop_codon:yes gene_type:complete